MSRIAVLRRPKIAAVDGTGLHPIVRGVTRADVTAGGTHAPYPAADLFAPEGTPIFAPEGCVSRPALYQFGGHTTTLEGLDTGRWYYLAHGQYGFDDGHQERGRIIGWVGSTGTGPGGFSASGGTAPHLHLAISSDGDFSRGHRGGSGDIWPTPDLWEMAGAGGSGQWPRYNGELVTREEIVDYIYRAAQVREMVWEHVRTVVNGEGGFDKPTQRNLAGEPAWGPLQLHVAAEDMRPEQAIARAIARAEPWRGYVGDQFIWRTGLHPSEIRAWKLAVDYGLDVAVMDGDWHQWYGAKDLPNGRFTRTGGRIAGFSEEALAYAGLTRDDVRNLV